jgi:phage terminase small subunit
MAGMNPKQRAFVREYLKDHNATQAAIRAGYSAKTAKQQGSLQLTKVDVAAAIAAAETNADENAGETREGVLRDLRTVANQCMNAVPILDSQGRETGEWKFDSSGANKALENIGKHLGMFKDRLEVSQDPSGQPLQFVVTAPKAKR